jgi:UDP-glucose:(heptosyl)LPS alpha-1,3-glucosyltransferase
VTDPRRTIAMVFPGCHRVGGVERVVRELARCLQSDQDVTFVGERFDPTDMEGIRLLPVEGRVPPGLSHTLSFRYRAERALRSRPFDLTVTFGAECPTGDVAVVGSVHRAWLAQRGAIQTPAGPLPSTVRYALPRHLAVLGLERTYFRSPRLRSVLATSRQTADEVVAAYDLDPDIVSVVPNGFDPDEFNGAVRVAERATRRSRLGWDGSVVLLFVGNELHRKGFATLLEAVALLGDPRLRVEVVGAASLGPYHRRIEALGLSDRVWWHGSQADLAPWYAAADLLVLPTQYEPFGNTIIEALATGLPVVTTTLAGASSAVVPDVNGLLQLDPVDAHELAGLLERALEGEHLADWSAQAGSGLECFEWSAIASRFEAALDRVDR